MKDHTFHIPVMGTGHSIDTPIRVAHLGISSVISIIDDTLIERIRGFYNTKHGLPYKKIYRFDEDARARRVTEYLETVQRLVRRNMETVRNLPFFHRNDKTKYFELLPNESPLKQEYLRMLALPPGKEREALEVSLTARMVPGAIDVNIMTKLDRLNVDKNGQQLPEQFSDAKSALRGFANSSLQSAVEFSAGFNRSLFAYLASFRDFYRTESGELKKRIILKVSDFRSASIQGHMLAKKGLEVHEFRIESGLNCGGHAFPSNGQLLPTILREFREKREQLKAEFLPFIQRFYESMGWEYPHAAKEEQPILTVQGGIGTHGEDRRMREYFGMDRTGWATPFLLVPEATCVDDATRELLRRAKEEDVYVSDASPLGISFNNIRGSGSEVWTRKRAEKGKPGSPCPKGHLVSDTEFTREPICTASTQYQTLKLEQISGLDIATEQKQKMIDNVLVKTCLCEHLGNGALITHGVAHPSQSPQAICPGPNIAWFDRIYTLQEMVDHIYGRGSSLVPQNRPHMFSKEVIMYVDFLERLIAKCGYTEREVSTLREFKDNLERGMDLCLQIASDDAFPGENISTIEPTVEEQRMRLRGMFEQFELRSAAVFA
ncbi:MAG TPA: hypothetical protein VJN65_09130 [Bacteroidota bacterium]|nr:hypothetical protein [Bacteroidota bacterium]